MPEPRMTAREAIARLKEGNQRFASNVRSVDSLLTQTQRSELVSGQRPIAIVLGCSDSRAPAELIFDQGIGDLFVIRVAGNIVAPSQIGSIEFAAERFGTQLVVVMGHTHCGAIGATLESIAAGPPAPPSEPREINLRSIVDRIRPSIEHLVREDADPEKLKRDALRANVRASAATLRSAPVLEQLVREQGLLVVGAELDIETGLVDFFDGAPE